MRMDAYRRISQATTVAVGALVAIAVITRSYLLSAFSVICGIIVLAIARSKVKEKLKDERTAAIAAKASRMTIILFGPAGAAASFILLYMGQETIGSTIAYCVCALLIIDSVFTWHYSRKL